MNPWGSKHVGIFYVILKYKYLSNNIQTVLRSVKLTTGKKGKKIEWTGRGPLKRRRSALDCSATEEEARFCAPLVGATDHLHGAWSLRN
jgi:hypothetical protein